MKSSRFQLRNELEFFCKAEPELFFLMEEEAENFEGRCLEMAPEMKFFEPEARTGAKNCDFLNIGYKIMRKMIFSLYLRIVRTMDI